MRPGSRVPRRIRALCGAAGCVLFSLAPLFADDHTAASGFYFGLGAAMNFADATTQSSSVRVADDLGTAGLRFYDSTWLFEPGSTFSGAAGYAFGNVRLEGEFSYTTSSIGHWSWLLRDASGNIVNRTIIERRLDWFGMMANAWYDIDGGLPATPYLGGGLGAVYLAAVETEWGESVGSVDIGDYDFLEAAGVGIGFHVGAGFGIDLLESLQLRIGYRVTAVTAAKLAEERDTETGTDTYPRTHHLPTLLEQRIELRLSYQSS